MSSALWATLIAIAGSTIFGVLGIMIVLLAGLLLVLPVKAAR
jgi:UMF1 family MFS transporter